MESLGYVLADMDQWGRSYRHEEDHHHTAEVDELAEGAAAVRVVLGVGGLGPDDICRVRGELARRYRDMISAVGTYRQDKKLTYPWRPGDDYRAPAQRAEDLLLEDPIDAGPTARAYF